VKARIYERRPHPAKNFPHARCEHALLIERDSNRRLIGVFSQGSLCKVSILERNKTATAANDLGNGVENSSALFITLPLRTIMRRSIPFTG
jgi:hypothetical protein